VPGVLKLILLPRRSASEWISGRTKMCRSEGKSNCVIRCGFVVCFDEGAAVLGPVNDAAPPSAVAVSHH